MFSHGRLCFIWFSYIIRKQWKTVAFNLFSKCYLHNFLVRLLQIFVESYVYFQSVMQGYVLYFSPNSYTTIKYLMNLFVVDAIYRAEIVRLWAKGVLQISVIKKWGLWIRLFSQRMVDFYIPTTNLNQAQISNNSYVDAH